jgi:hypothetical protein
MLRQSLRWWRASQRPRVIADLKKSGLLPGEGHRWSVFQRSRAGNAKAQRQRSWQKVIVGWK